MPRESETLTSNIIPVFVKTVGVCTGDAGVLIDSLGFRPRYKVGEVAVLR